MEKLMRYSLVCPRLGIILLVSVLGCAAQRQRCVPGESYGTCETVTVLPGAQPYATGGPDLTAPPGPAPAPHAPAHLPAPAGQPAAARPAPSRLEEPTLGQELAAEQLAARSVPSPYAAGRVRVTVWPLAKAAANQPRCAPEVRPPVVAPEPVPVKVPAKTVLASSGVPVTSTPARATDQVPLAAVEEAPTPGKTPDKTPAAATTVPPVIQTLGWKGTPTPVSHDNLPDPAPATTPRSEDREKGLPQVFPPGTTRQRFDVNLPPRPGFGHAADYSWVSGELDYLHGKKAWRVRYANLDEEDRYGGSVILVEDEGSSLQRFKAGQMVRIEGHFAKPGESETCPLYRIHSICTAP
jgi:hypothetical protein